MGEIFVKSFFKFLFWFLFFGDFLLSVAAEVEPEPADLRRPLVEPSRSSNSEIGHEMESVLSDQGMPYLKRLYIASLIELNLLFRLAAPAVFVYLVNTAMTLSIRIFAGHLGSLELAAVSLANSGFNLFTYGLLLGMGSAVETLCGQAYGGGRHEMLGIYLQRATVVLCITGIPMAILYLLSQPILLLLREPSHLASISATFIYGMIPQIFAYAFNFPIQKFLQAQSIVLPTAYISAMALFVQIFLTWIAVFRLGFDLIGMSLVHSGVWWITVGSQMVYIKMSPRCRTTWTGLSFSGAFGGLWGFFKLSAASAVMLCLEAWYSQILVLLAGLLPNPELSLDSLAICMSISSISFMVSVGFNAAASVRVSNELGAGNPKSAAFTTVVVTVVAFILAVGQAIAVLSYRHVISYIFTGSEAVAEAVSDLCPYLCITILLNGIQPVLSGVAVGCGWQTFVAYVNVGCYYVVGIPLGCLLGFVYNQGAKGIWTGMIGGTFIQTLILLYVTYRTNWDAEVEKATKRLDQLETQKQPLLKK